MITVKTSKKSIKTVFPSGSVEFCGAKLPDRTCNSDSKDPDGAGGPIKISFGIDETESYSLDRGEVFG